VLRLVSFDIDGTLEFGDPPGIITVAMVRKAKSLGWLVGTCSDRPISAQRRLWDELGVAVDFAVAKPGLLTLRARFLAHSYVHIGDTNIDEQFARHAEFDFIHVDDVHQVPWISDLGSLPV
jgi:hydroxymethylpyrimidine pyrophosphatase-like HAD family hydrolase